MVETYSQILYLFSWESQYHKHSIKVTGYQCFTMKRKSYEVKKTNYSLGKQAGRSIPYLAMLKQSALAHFHQKRVKKQRDSPLAGSGRNDRFSPSWHEEVVLSSVSLKTLMAMLPCFHSVADSKFSLSLQLSRAEFVSLLLEAFSAFPCSWSLKFRNGANF